MIQENIYKLLNEQVNKEMFSAYLYLDISNYYIDNGLDGFSNWFKIQAQEEMDHAMLFAQYMQNNGLSVKLTEISAPKMEYSTYDVPLQPQPRWIMDHEQTLAAPPVSRIPEGSLQASPATQEAGAGPCQGSHISRNIYDLIERHQIGSGG